MNKEQIFNSVRSVTMTNTNIQITDNLCVEIDNCKKIIEYNDIYVKIKASTVIIEVWGRNLCINDYNRPGIEIKGIITNIELSKK